MRSGETSMMPVIPTATACAAMRADGPAVRRGDWEAGA